MLQSFLSVETLSITRGVGHRANFQQRTATFRDQAASLLPVKLSIREAVKFLGTVDSPNELVKYSPNNYKLPVKSTPGTSKHHDMVGNWLPCFYYLLPPIIRDH